MSQNRWLRFCDRLRSPAAKLERASRTPVRNQRLTANGSTTFCGRRRYGTPTPLRWRPPTKSGTRTEHFTEREGSALLRPLRSGASWANGRPHSGSRWFADTEEVTGSNPVAPTTILAGHGVASVEPVALATWLGRTGAARHPPRRACLVPPGPSIRTFGSAPTTQRSRGSRPYGRSTRCRAATSRASQLPCPSAVPSDGRPPGGLACLVGRPQPLAQAPPGPGPPADAPPPVSTRPPQAVPASMPHRAVDRAAGDGVGPQELDSIQS
jgi:hypothetical protein